MNKRLVRLMLIGITAMTLSGCANLSEVIPPPRDEEIEDDEVETPEVTDEDDEEQDGSHDEVKAYDSFILARTLQSDVFYIYDCNTDSLQEIDRKELAEETKNPNPSVYRLYSDELYSSSTLAGEGDGFLFFQDYVTLSDGVAHSIVYAVNEKTHKIYDIWQGSSNGYMNGCEYYGGCMYVDYIIGYDESYTSMGEDVACFQYDKETDSFTEVGVDPKLETIIDTVNVTGGHIRRSGNRCSAHIYEECGYVPAYLDGEVVLVNPDRTLRHIKGIDDGYYAYYDEHHIFSIVMDYETNTGTAYVYDLNTDSLIEISDERGADRLLGKVGHKYYYSVPEPEEYGIKHNYIYEYDADTDKSTLLYDVKSVPGSNIAPGVEGFTVTDTFIYYIGFDKGDTFWVPVEIKNPSAPYARIDLGHDSLFDYGTISYMSSSYACPKCDTVLYESYNEYPILDDSVSDNADKINEYLYEQAKEFNESTDEFSVIDSPCEDHQDHPSWYRVTNDYYVSGISEICDGYLTVDMSGYWYGGGAHGMPFRNQYLFDLSTGEAKTIADFYEGSEEDFKTLIAEKTRDDFLSYDIDNYESPYFAYDAETVYSDAYYYVSLNTGNVDFTEDGIIYYYEPYIMGPYAAGFIEIFISYDELLGRNTL